MTTQTRTGLARFWERARSEPGLGKNIVVIIGLIVLGTVVGSYFLAHARFNPPWEDKKPVYATFEEAPAIAPGKGQEVRIAGVPVGDIRDASLNDDGDAVVKLMVDDDHVIYDNATVVLRPKSPLNPMYIELDPGGPPGTPLSAGEVLPAENTVRPIQIDQALSHLDDNAQAAITTLLSEADIALASAPAKLPAGLRNTDKVLADLQPVMQELTERRDKLARLVTAMSDISTAVGGDDERLVRLANSLQTTLGAVATRSDSLDRSLAQLPEFANELRQASVSVSALIEQLNPTLDNILDASDVLPDALSRFDDSVEELDSFLDEAKPVVDKAVPVVDDLQPAVADLSRIAGDLRPITARLDEVTKTLVPHLEDLAAFVYNTNSVTSLKDANRGIVRGQLSVSTESIPAGILQSILPGN